MENKNTGVLINSVTWGAILGIILIAYSLVLYFSGLSLESWKSLGDYVLIITIIIVGTKSYRDKILGGYISYGKALGFGVLIALTASLMMAVYNHVYLNYIDTDFIEKTLAMMENKLLEQNLPDEQIEMSLSIQRKIMKPSILSLMLIPSTTFTGFIFSLITSIFIKKEEPLTSF